MYSISVLEQESAQEEQITFSSFKIVKKKLLQIQKNNFPTEATVFFNCFPGKLFSSKEYLAYLERYKDSVQILT